MPCSCGSGPTGTPNPVNHLQPDERGGRARYGSCGVTAPAAFGSPGVWTCGVSRVRRPLIGGQGSTGSVTISATGSRPWLRPCSCPSSGRRSGNCPAPQSLCRQGRTDGRAVGVQRVPRDRHRVGRELVHARRIRVRQVVVAGRVARVDPRLERSVGERPDAGRADAGRGHSFASACGLARRVRGAVGPVAPDRPHPGHGQALQPGRHLDGEGAVRVAEAHERRELLLPERLGSGVPGVPAPPGNAARAPNGPLTTPSVAIRCAGRSARFQPWPAVSPIVGRVKLAASAHSASTGGPAQRPPRSTPRGRPRAAREPVPAAPRAGLGAASPAPGRAFRAPGLRAARPRRRAPPRSRWSSPGLRVRFGFVGEHSRRTSKAAAHPGLHRPSGAPGCATTCRVPLRPRWRSRRTARAEGMRAAQRTFMPRSAGGRGFYRVSVVSANSTRPVSSIASRRPVRCGGSGPVPGSPVRPGVVLRRRARLRGRRAQPYAGYLSLADYVPDSTCGTTFPSVAGSKWKRTASSSRKHEPSASPAHRAEGLVVPVPAGGAVVVDVRHE